MPRRVRVALVLVLVAALAGVAGLSAVSPGQRARDAAPLPSGAAVQAALDRSADRAFFEEADRSRLLISDRAQALLLRARQDHARTLAAQARARARAAVLAVAAARHSALVAARRAAAAQQAARAEAQAGAARRTAAVSMAQPSGGSAGGSYSSAEAWAASAGATRVRQCESGDNYGADTGNGYYGAYQFSESTWRAVGGQGYPQQSSPREQDYRAYLLWQRSGWSAWGCA